MTAPVQYVSTGITVTYGTLAAELIDVDLGGETEDVVKLPNQAGGYMNKLASGIQDAGTITLTIGWDPDNSILPALGYSGSLVLTGPTGTVKKLTVTAILKKRHNISAKVGTRIIDNLEMELSGTPAWA